MFLTWDTNSVSGVLLTEPLEPCAKTKTKKQTHRKVRERVKVRVAPTTTTTSLDDEPCRLATPLYLKSYIHNKTQSQVVLKQAIRHTCPEAFPVDGIAPGPRFLGPPSISGSASVCRIGCTR